MKAKNVASIFFSKFSLVYKVILFLLIITLFISIIGAGILLPILNGLRKDMLSLNLSENAGEYVKSLISGRDSGTAFENLMDSFKKIPGIIQRWDVNVALSIATLLLMVVIFAILYFMAYYSLSDVLHQFMSSNSKFGFTANYIYNGRKSFIFAAVYAPLAIVFYVLLGGAVLGITYLLSKLSAYLGIVSGYFFLIFGLALRRSLFAFWIPSMVVDGLSVKDAFSKNFQMLKNNFAKILGEYFMVAIVGVIITLITAVATASLGIIVSYCVVWIIMEIMDLVEYYTIKEYKFYIDDQTVFDPKKKFKDAVLDDSYSL